MSRRFSRRLSRRGRRTVALACAVLSVAACSAWLPRAARADDPAGERQPKGKFADMVRQDRDRAQYSRHEYGDVVESASAGGRFEGIVKEDLILAKPAFDAEAALLDRAADAWEAEDQPKAQQLRTEAEAATRVKNLWRQRLLEWRRRQGEAAPTESWYHSALAYVRPEARAEVRPLVDACLRTRRAAADAWGRVAEATVPGADPAAVTDLKEKAYAADAEREMAEWQYVWARERALVWADRQATSDDLVKLDETLRQLHEGRLQLRREQIDRDRRARDLEERTTDAEARFRKAYEAAAQAAAEAKQRAAQKKK